MQLQRWLLKDKTIGVYVGEHLEARTYDYNWFVAENRVGVTTNPSTPAECFVGGFLVKEDILTIKLPESYPILGRESNSSARMGGRDSGIGQVSGLVKLLKGQDTTHVYLASERADGTYPSILSFSPSTPPEILYTAGKVMPVETISHDFSDDFLAALTYLQSNQPR